MAEIRSSASYVRHEPQRHLDREQVLRSLQRPGSETAAHTAQIWDLLETPHTVKSLSRALGDADDEEVTDTLSQLLEADLIEIAPDT